MAGYLLRISKSLSLNTLVLCRTYLIHACRAYVSVCPFVCLLCWFGE